MKRVSGIVMAVALLVSAAMPAAAFPCGWAPTAMCAVATIAADMKGADFVHSDAMIDLAHAQAAIGSAAAARESLSRALAHARRGTTDPSVLLESLADIAAAQDAVGDGDGMRATLVQARQSLAGLPASRRAGTDLVALAALAAIATRLGEASAAEERADAMARLAEEIGRSTHLPGVERSLRMLLPAAMAHAPEAVAGLAEQAEALASPDHAEFLLAVLAMPWPDGEAPRRLLRKGLAASSAASLWLLEPVERWLGRQAAIDYLAQDLDYRRPKGVMIFGSDLPHPASAAATHVLDRAEALTGLGETELARRAVTAARAAHADLAGRREAAALERRIALVAAVVEGDLSALRKAAGDDVWQAVAALAVQHRFDAVHGLLPHCRDVSDNPVSADIKARFLRRHGDYSGAWYVASRIAHDDVRRAQMAATARALAEAP